MSKKTRFPTVLALGVSALAAGCGGPQSPGGPAAAPPGPVPLNYEHQSAEEVRPSLNLGSYRYIPSGTGLSQDVSSAGSLDLSVDFGLALRTAAIKLTGDLPTMADIRALQRAVQAGATDGSDNDPAALYGKIVHRYIYDSPASFNRQMVQFWRNQFRMGGTLKALFADKPDTGDDTNKRMVSLETAPTFAARLVADEADMRKLFTQDKNACPSFDPQSGKFTDGNCSVDGGGFGTPYPGNNVPEGKQAGVLTNPGFLAQYYSNFGFRRSRLINELFACTRLPAEFSPSPTVQGDYLYSSPWPYNSVSNAAQVGKDAPYAAQFNLGKLPRMVRGGGTADNMEYVNFRGDCQNCHSTQNHRAPLFAMFDQVGYRDPNNNFMVTSTATGSPFAQIQEYLYQCNPDPKNPTPNAVCKGALAWKYYAADGKTLGKRIDIGGTDVPDFQSFGQEMAQDPQTAKCMMIRVWNHAYSRDDVVNELALVPDSVISELTRSFQDNGYNMKKALYQLYTSANFIRF